MDSYFSNLLPDLATRARLAAISRLGFANVPLHRHLAEIFSRPYGEPGSFLADPTFEAVFGWQAANCTMQQLAGNLLTQELVNAMDTPPPKLREDYRFAKTRSPYKHQLEAWKILAKESPQSLVVTSGTGSGKTECFMVPILDSLIRQQIAQQGKLIGVRALFLYPLNALINSQRERLQAWTESFGENLRFCLYNGNTLEKPEPKRNQREHPSEVADRETLRSSPPPILVTNATMLEYMLVRTTDSPILEKSQGKLEWLVLDEAHTYIGSQAAELALLIRRVLLAFGVKPEQVHFVATSATIGDPNSEAGEKLKRFLADVGGVGLERVHLVSGKRDIPSLPRMTQEFAKPLTEMFHIEDAVSMYNILLQHPVARRLRDAFVEHPDKPVVRISGICAVLFGEQATYSLDQQQQALQWLDLMSAGQNGADVFLPLRAHLFHQTLSGLWACADQSCSHKDNTPLHDPAWPFGRVYLELRKHCACGSPVYEIVSCGDCGAVHLLAGEQQGRLTQWQPQAALDEFELEMETEETQDSDEENEEATNATPQNKVLIVNRLLQHVGAMDIERDSLKIVGLGENTLRVWAHEDDGDGMLCPICDFRENRKNPFQFGRLGAPFLLGSILPTLLEYAPDGNEPVEQPYRGRRLLTFNDSRQGTARIAAKLQQDAERNRIRGLVYHLTLQSGRKEASVQVDSLRKEIETLENIPSSARNAAIDNLISLKHAEVAKLLRPVPIPFNELAQKLAGEGRDFENMLARYRRYDPGTFGETSGVIELARMFLVREFGRRPKRLNNLESMGMVAVRYPALDQLSTVPPAVVQVAGFNLDTWRDFLKLCLDFFVRAGGSLEISSAWRNWLGMPFPQTSLIKRDEQAALWQRRWPRAKRSGLKSSLVRLLAQHLKVDIAIPSGEDKVDAILLAAWETLSSIGLLQQRGDGRILPLECLAFSPIEQAWICPFTRRFMDTTLAGLSPYSPQKADNNTLCEQVRLPLYDEPFSGETDDLARIRRGRQWLEARSEITELRNQGLWPILNDRVIELAPYFTTAEHSAQQDSQKLDAYEKDFKAGKLNLLSCSTTMEMGIDIGRLGVVAMNNVPPHPANYLQRAGRVGRRHETRSLALTLCKSNPHDQAVFSNTRWAFDTLLPAPRVALDSPIIVQRHLHSFLLSSFLREALQNSQQEQTKLTCGLFFVGEATLAERYVSWCRTPSTQSNRNEGLRHLVRHSVFEGANLEHLTCRAAEAMEQLEKQWLQEWEQLQKEAGEARRAGESSPAFRAVQFHQTRLSDEYLLRELATRGYLPAYGFPTHITPFDNLTAIQFARAKSQAEKSREDNRYRRRELASRDLTTALREYAPGSEVVMDGLVYRSAGITLNWHIPADQQDANEIQSIRHLCRCQHCGASAYSFSLDSVRYCDACGESIAASNIREVLEPAGFSVDFYKNPSNDVTTQHFVPVEAPWIDVRGDWVALLTLGRFRFSPQGHIFHQSRGIHGKGYAICLECGRAEPMPLDGNFPEIFQKSHRKLRRNKEDGVYCSGSENAWKIKPNITLGHEIQTDALELQLKTENGVWLNDRIVARTIAVTLRDALAELIGVQADELGCDIKEARSEQGGICQSILIFDRHAAGYAANVVQHWSELFKRAKKRLECPADCDSACPHCVLDFDQRFNADNLNRHKALEVLNSNWLNLLKLPDDLAYFGSSSRSEYAILSEAVWRESLRHEGEKVRLFCAGETKNWDIAVSPLRHLAYRLAEQQREVTLVMPHACFTALNETDCFSLASLSHHPYIKIATIIDPPRVGSGIILAEVIKARESVIWASEANVNCEFGVAWGNTTAPVIQGKNETAQRLNEILVSPETLRSQLVNAGDLEIEMHHQLNGAIQEFGKRFWDKITELHPASKALLENNAENITHIGYQDRYIFTPISFALLSRIINALREYVGGQRWQNPQIVIETTQQRTSGESRARGVVWADWINIEQRNEVALAVFKLLKMQATLPILDKTATHHGRLLNVKFDSGQQLTIRLDQGVSYWRAAPSEPKRHFDFFAKTESQAKNIVEMAIKVEGSLQPTELFVKVRG